MKNVFTKKVLLSQLALVLGGLAIVPAAQASSEIIYSNDAKTTSFKFKYDITRVSNPKSSRQIYIDIDKNKTTGFTYGGLAAEYALFDGRLYRYTGTGGYNWHWTLVSLVSFTDDGKEANWTVALKDLANANNVIPSSINLIGALNGTVIVSKLEQTFSNEPVTLLRDPLQWPFASTSIWNMPIGSDAVYVHANLAAVPGNDPWSPMPATDPDRIVFTPDAPLTPIRYNSSAWSGADRCAPSSELVLDTLPIPVDYVVPNSRHNNSAAFLKSDNRTIVQTQPFTRCEVGGVATSLLTFAPVDLYGDGITGSHGGSRLSSVGGSIRLGELRPLPPGVDPYTTGMRHSVKLNVDSREALFACTTMADCFRWPAQAADSDAVGSYGSKPNLVTPGSEMKMGALLAIPANVDISKLGLKTEPAKQLAWTLQNYGAYIVDSIGGAGYDFSVENGSRGSFTAQFQADWGFAFGQRVRDNTDWVHDIQTLITSLHVVNNNSPTSIGGGGVPRQPLAPPLP